METSVFKLTSKTAISAFVAILAGCASAAPDASPAPPPAPAQATAVAPQAAEYTLDTGDKIHITVYDEKDLSGDFVVSGQGDISMQLIGEVKAKGMTLRDLQRAIETRYKDGQFLRNPQVSAEVVNYRPFYIRGEVRNSGEYPYQSGLTVMNAIARAGDFSYRADKKHVWITSKSSSEARKVDLTSDLMVQPGDTIEIKDRLF